MTLMGRNFFILLRTVFDLLWLVLGCGKLWIADGIWNAMPNLQDGQCNSSYFQVAK